MPSKFFSGGAWRNTGDVKILIGGAWQRVTIGKTLIGGAWQTTYQYDVTGPAAVTGFTAQWNNATGNTCSVSWTQPTDIDLSYVDLYVNRAASSTGPWTYVGRYTGTGSKSYVDTNVTLSSFTTHGPNSQSPIHYYRTVPYDTLGNVGTEAIVGSTGSGQSVVRGMYSTPYYVLPTDSRTWRNSSWRSDTVVQDGAGLFERVVQGRTVNGENYGHFFYNVFPTGMNVTNAKIYNVRQDGGLGAGTEAYMRASSTPQSFVGAGTTPVGATTSSVVLGLPFATPSNGGTRSGMSGIPLGWIDGFQAGTYKSILFYTGETTGDPSTKYAVWSSMNEDTGFGITPGYLEITHTG